MESAGTRALAAALLLAAYYVILIVHPFPGAAAADDSGTRALIESSRTLFEAKRFADALPPTAELTTRFPSQAVYHDRHARILHELNRPAEEAQAWERLLEVSATPVDGCPMIGDAYAQAGQADQALAAYLRCADLPPQNPDFLLAAGQLLLKANRNAEARAAFERGLALAPGYSDLHLLVGVRMFADGDAVAARKHFERFLELSPERRDEVAVWLERTAAAK